MKNLTDYWKKMLSLKEKISILEKENKLNIEINHNLVERLALLERRDRNHAEETASNIQKP